MRELVQIRKKKASSFVCVSVVGVCNARLSSVVPVRDVDDSACGEKMRN